MTVNDVYKWLDSFAPFDTQEDYDNAGLIVGHPDEQVSHILFTLDVTPAAVQEAAAIGAELIVAHHPLMFHPMQALLFDRGEGEVLKALAVSGISLIAAHTNLDQCPGGIADSLADALQLSDMQSSPASPYLRSGTLPDPVKAGDFLSFVSQALHYPVRLHGSPDRVLHSIALAPGAAGEDAVHVTEDAFITGEIKHHELLAAAQRGLTVFEAGHYPTEFPGIAALHSRFNRDASGSGWAVTATLFSQPPEVTTA